MKPASQQVRDQILALFDAGYTPVQIGLALPDVKRGLVYGVLRLKRPDRKRAPRRRTSTVRPKVLALRAAGVDHYRIADLLGVDPVYVYRLAAEARLVGKRR